MAALAVALLCAAAAGEEVRPADRIRELLAAAKFAEALQEAEALLARADALEPPDPEQLAVALDLTVQARFYSGLAAEPETLEIARRAVSIKQEALGADSPVVATSINAVAIVHFRRGEFAEAKAAYERAIGIWESASGPNDPRIGNALTNLSILLRKMGDMKGALDASARAIAIRESAGGEGDPTLASALHNHANLLTRMSRFDQALQYEQRALVIRESVLPPDHPDIATSLTTLGNIRWKTGAHRESIALKERALEILESRLGKDHLRLAPTLVSLAVSHHTLGEFERAGDLYRRALKIEEAGLGPEHPDIPITLNNLANLEKVLGDLPEARRHLQRALRILEQVHGADHPDVALSRTNLAILLVQMGEFTGAASLYEQALESWRSTYGPEHPKIAVVLNSLADLRYQTGDFESAERLAREGLRIRKKVHGERHEDVAASLHRLGEILATMPRLEEAADALREALEIRRRILGEAHYLVGDSYGALSRVSLQRNEREEAQSHGHAALKIYRETFGQEHPRYAYGLFMLADALWKSGEVEDAAARIEEALPIYERILGPGHHLRVRMLGRAAEIDLALGKDLEAFRRGVISDSLWRNHLRLSIRAFPETQALQYASYERHGLDAALSVAVRTGGKHLDRIREGWTALARSRAVVLDEIASRRKKMFESDEPEIQALTRSFLNARTRLANLMIRGPEPDEPGRYLTVIRKAKREKEEIERDLASRFASYRRSEEIRSASIERILAAMPEGGALVGYGLYGHLSPIDPERDGPDHGPPVAVPSYLAFVVEKNGRPVLVSLGEAESIDGKVRAWRRAAGTYPEGLPLAGGPEEERYRETAQQLREAIWDPVARHLNGAGTVFVVPDGELHLVSLATLPAPRGRYLAEEGPSIHYLSAERDLLGGGATGRRSAGLIAFGGPAFDADPVSVLKRATAEEIIASASGPRLRGGGTDCSSLATLRFGSLPAARNEVEAIGKLWREKISGEGDEPPDSGNLLFTGTEATERNFKLNASGFRIVHLATHAFLANGRCQANPLSLSGLALAGANRRSEGEGPGVEDGILTAEEIAALDLDGVEWAVLSACETGIGEAVAGEGVLGLRRSFQTAGVGTLVMSLWDVEDVATLRWMERLYRARLGGATTVDAVRSASMEVLEERRSSGKSTHPFYWGAFVAVGDWR